MAFGQRVKEVREEKNMTQLELADLFGVAQGIIQQLEQRDSKKSKYSRAIAEALGVNENWLLYGDGVKYTSNGQISHSHLTFKKGVNVEKLTYGLRAVPMITMDKVAHWKEEISSEPIDFSPSSSISLSDNAFSLTVTDLSMMPEYKPNDVIIVDPDAKPEPGSVVIAIDANQNGYFRKYRSRGQTKEGKERFELAPLNDDFPILFSESDSLVIIGRVVEHHRKL